MTFFQLKAFNRLKLALVEGETTGRDPANRWKQLVWITEEKNSTKLWMIIFLTSLLDIYFLVHLYIHWPVTWAEVFLCTCNNLRSINLSSDLGLPPPPPLFSLIRLFIAILINDCYWSEENFLSLIGFHYRDTHNRDRQKSSGKAHLFNIWTMDRISGQLQLQVNLSLLRSICLKIRQQATYSQSWQ